MNNKILSSIILGCLMLLSLTITTSAYSYGEYLTYKISDWEIEITDCNTSISNSLEIPNQINGYPVTTIGAQAFMDCKHLSNILLPNSITSIKSKAFYNCQRLKSINIPKNVTFLGGAAFYGCGSLNNIFISEGVTSIKGQTFYGCHSLKNISIPKEITSIGNEAFKDCIALKNISIPEGCSSIGNEAFNGCVSLKEINIPYSVTFIGQSAFNNSRYNQSENLITTYYGTPDEWKKIEIGTLNELLMKNVNFIKHIRAEKKNEIILIEPVNIESGKIVIIALYNEDILSKLLLTSYTGEIISLTTEVPYTNAKVLLWNDLFSMTPVCEIKEL